MTVIANSDIKNLRIKTRNFAEDYIFEDELRLLSLYKKYIPLKSNILKVGCGVGFTLKILKEYLGITPTVLEIKDSRHPQLDMPIKIYDGKHIPFPNNYFSISLIFYTLHHASHPNHLLKEVHRVSQKALIVEETPKNFFQRFFLFINDFLINFFAGQSYLQIPYYLDKKGWIGAFKKTGFHIEGVIRVNSHLRWYKPYAKYLFVLTK